VHKIKPAFGFIGMMQMQQKCQQLEDHCKNASSVSDVQNEATSVLNECRQSQQVIQNEYERLKKFNSSTT
jgi:HPt (histidine-containing phosphotransfer) domain-containing protein